MVYKPKDKLLVDATDSGDFLVAAQEEWKKEYEHALQKLVDENTSRLYWRTDRTTDFRGKRVPVSAVRLIRWDQLPPSVVFAHGFKPLQNDPKDKSTNFSLEEAKLDKTPSPFVFATSCFADRDSQNVTRWKPRSYDTLARRVTLYEYEIFAYGALDVDRAFQDKLSDANSTIRKGDVAFLGGIRSQFIRSATEYDELGRVKQYWINGSFDVGANGKYRPIATDLPPHINPSNLPITVWTKGSSPQVDVKSSLSTEDTMATFEGTQESIVVGDAFNRPLSRAFVPLQTDDDEIEGYFFTDTRFVQIKYDSYNQAFDTVKPAKNITSVWQSLDQLGFATVDAILPVTGGQAWFFSGRKQVSVAINSFRQSDKNNSASVSTIVAASNSLRKAGFSTVDAVHSLGNGKTAFFRGTNCVVVNTATDKITEGPKSISAKFPALADVGFTSVDVIFPASHKGDETFVFSGDEFVRTNATLEKVTLGPKRIEEKMWKCLTESGFY